MTPVRYNRSVLGEYEALDHSLQPRNHHKQELLGTVAERMLTDGLSSLRYSVEDFQLRELYTWFLVRPPQPPALYNTTIDFLHPAAKRKSPKKQS
ncbi:hypothetical protein BaRGS_00024380 [Batillaria attramentaria]|uniref:Uncharacterized protein n=1 Tax=Batillaria attramentaria TaxID=370345 RepID=A0ABD0KB94_9CAEN